MHIQIQIHIQSKSQSQSRIQIPIWNCCKCGNGQLLGTKLELETCPRAGLLYLWHLQCILQSAINLKRKQKTFCTGRNCKCGNGQLAARNPTRAWNLPQSGTIISLTPTFCKEQNLNFKSVILKRLVSLMLTNQVCNQSAQEYSITSTARDEFVLVAEWLCCTYDDRGAWEWEYVGHMTIGEFGIVYGSWTT